MLKKELVGALKSKKTLLFLVIIILIPIIDLSLVCKQDRVWTQIAHKDELMKLDQDTRDYLLEIGDTLENLVGNWIRPPAQASFLSGVSESHVPQLLLIWLMPLFVLNLISDRYILEYKRGYLNALFIRSSKKKVIINKLICSFIIPFLAYATSLLINFGLAQIIYKDGDNFMGYETFRENGGWFKFMIDNPNKSYLTYLLLTCICAGFCGVICSCFAMLLKKYSLTYIISFFLWMGLVMMKDTIINIVQPFTEYGAKYMIKPGIILIIITLLITIFTFIYKGKIDEL